LIELLLGDGEIAELAEAQGNCQTEVFFCAGKITYSQSRFGGGELAPQRFGRVISGINEWSLESGGEKNYRHEVLS